MRKKVNLLTTGLSSELFLLAYLEPNNVRQLAQKLQNTSGNPTNYSKANPTIHDLTIAKYLKFHDDDEKYYVNISKLTEEIKQILETKNTVIDEEDEQYLTRLLKDNAFFKILSKDVIEKIQMQEKGIHKINALEVICERIGLICASMLLQKTLNLQDVNEMFDTSNSFDENMKQTQDIAEFWNEKMSNFDQKLEEHLNKNGNEIVKMMMTHPIFKDMIIPMLKNMPSILTVFTIPQKTLEKLMKLWNGHEGITLSLQAFSQLKES